MIDPELARLLFQGRPQGTVPRDGQVNIGQPGHDTKLEGIVLLLLHPADCDHQGDGGRQVEELARFRDRSGRWGPDQAVRHHGDTPAVAVRQAGEGLAHGVRHRDDLGVDAERADRAIEQAHDPRDLGVGAALRGDPVGHPGQPGHGLAERVGKRQERHHGPRMACPQGAVKQPGDLQIALQPGLGGPEDDLDVGVAVIEIGFLVQEPDLGRDAAGLQRARHPHRRFLGAGHVHEGDQEDHRAQAVDRRGLGAFPRHHSCRHSTHTTRTP